MTLRAIAGAVLVIGAFWNLHDVSVRVANLSPRNEEPVTIVENQYIPIELAMVREQTNIKRVGYITALTLKGTPPDESADLRWAQLRYLMIPRLLVRGAGEPYVIGDFKPGEPPPAVPENLVEVYDSGNGMILYKQKQTP
jgi:hypothetical protein